MPAKPEDLPSTLERSPDKVQRTYEKTLDSAHDQYGDEERAHRTAWASVKNVAEKQGDHWELKEARTHPARSYGGVDVNKPKTQLLQDAREAGIDGRTRMTKEQLADALQHYNDRATARARKDV